MVFGENPSVERLDGCYWIPSEVFQHFFCSFPQSKATEKFQVVHELWLKCAD